MRIEPINNTNFMAGKVYLKQMSPEHLLTFDAIKKLAEEKKADVFISKHKKSKNLIYEDIYTVTASKNIPLTHGDFPVSNKKYRSVSDAIVGKRAFPQEIAEKIYSAAVQAIEHLA